MNEQITEPRFQFPSYIVLITLIVTYGPPYEPDTRIARELAGQTLSGQEIANIILNGCYDAANEVGWEDDHARMLLNSGCTILANLREFLPEQIYKEADDAMDQYLTEAGE